jgi:hypothetical protein
VVEAAVTSPGAAVVAVVAVVTCPAAAVEAAAATHHPEKAAAADILHLEAAGASPTSDDLLMPLSRPATRSRNSGRPMLASLAHTLS